MSIKYDYLIIIFKWLHNDGPAERVVGIFFFLDVLLDPKTSVNSAETVVKVSLGSRLLNKD